MIERRHRLNGWGGAKTRPPVTSAPPLNCDFTHRLGYRKVSLAVCLIELVDPVTLANPSASLMPSSLGNWQVNRLSFTRRSGPGTGYCVMPDYRLYCLDGAGRIRLADWITADTDEAAIEKVRSQYRGAVKCEIWHRQRLVKALNAQDLS